LFWRRECGYYTTRTPFKDHDYPNVVVGLANYLQGDSCSKS